MTEKATSLISIQSLGKVEAYSLIVTALLTVVNYFLASTQMALGVLAGGVLFTANFIAIRFVVTAIISSSSSVQFGIFALFIKLAIFIGIVASIFVFSEINIYGFFIGITGVVIVIIGENLRRSTNGSL